MGKKSQNSPPDYRMNLESLRNAPFTRDNYAQAHDIPVGQLRPLTEKEAIDWCGTPAVLITVTFHSNAELHLTSYPLDVKFKGVTYKSTADMQEIPKVKQSESLKTDGVKIKMSAIDPTILDLLMNGSRDAKVTQKLVFMSDDAKVNADASFDAYTGFITVTEFNLDSKQGTLNATIETENILKNLERIQGHRHAHAVQQQIAPEPDDFFSLINNQDNSDWKVRG